MNDITYLVGTVALLLVLVLFVIYARRILDWWDQKQTDNKRERAHKGQVKCEEENERCDRTATHLTHNGYYCPEHWEPNSKQETAGGFVTWHHVLYHAVRRS